VEEVEEAEEMAATTPKKVILKKIRICISLSVDKNIPLQ
jgi:hypothetical protein